jgi:hypothetical protein
LAMLYQRLPKLSFVPHADGSTEFCDYLSIARPEYIKVEDSIFGVRFLTQFPASEIFLNRVGNIGLTGPIIGFEQGKEICADNVEVFLMDQVENGSFELQEGSESDDSAAHFLYNINRQITAGEVTQRHLQLSPIGPTIL